MRQKFFEPNEAVKILINCNGTTQWLLGKVVERQQVLLEGCVHRGMGMPDEMCPICNIVPPIYKVRLEYKGKIYLASNVSPDHLSHR